MSEASNLVQMPGRRVAPPGATAKDPAIELTPEQIEQLMASDRASWIALSHGLHDSAEKVLVAIRKRSVDELSDAGGDIDTACENCHLKYWYPEEKK